MSRPSPKDKSEKNLGVNPGGRPRKFSESSRPVTLTLPERTLSQLESLDSDRARAIVKATDAALRSGPGKESDAKVEVVKVDGQKGIILVGPSRYLKKIPFLNLIEIAPTRFLLVIPTGTSIESLEVAVMELVQEIPEQDQYELSLLKELSRCLAHQRRNKNVSKAELLLVDVAEQSFGFIFGILTTLA
jgi:hypothetical protein